jgi:hypothetical protein
VCVCSLSATTTAVVKGRHPNSFAFRHPGARTDDRRESDPSHELHSFLPDSAPDQSAHTHAMTSAKDGAPSGDDEVRHAIAPLLSACIALLSSPHLLPA